MTQETFLSCDAPACSKATRQDSEEASTWWQATGSFYRNDEPDEADPEEYEVDACSIECLTEALGPALLVSYLNTKSTT